MDHHGSRNKKNVISLWRHDEKFLHSAAASDTIFISIELLYFFKTKAEKEETSRLCLLS